MRPLDGTNPINVQWARPPWKQAPYRVWPVPGMVLLGARFRNGRMMAGVSQRHIAELSGVSQTAISRLERGLATGMSAERLIRIADAIGESFPFGYCPHHRRGCPYPLDPRDRSSVLALLGD
jgi:DNA-binding XRE family transcriptional regulator